MHSVYFMGDAPYKVAFPLEALADAGNALVRMSILVFAYVSVVLQLLKDLH